ncbi:MAG: hypothetical protein ACREDO_11710 [Methyloceanibacter sp.]
MAKRALFAAVFLAIAGPMIAEHAIDPTPGQPREATMQPAHPRPALVDEPVHAPLAEPAHTPVAEPAPVHEPTAPAPVAEPAPVSAPEPEATFQRAAMREVCTTSEWEFGEIRTDCRTEYLRPSKGNPALDGICTTYYGHRTCH